MELFTIQMVIDSKETLLLMKKTVTELFTIQMVVDTKETLVVIKKTVTEFNIVQVVDTKEILLMG